MLINGVPGIKSGCARKEKNNNNKNNNNNNNNNIKNNNNDNIIIIGTGSRRKEGNVLFNDALNTFYLRLYGVGHMVKDHSDSERGNPLPPHRLLFPFSSKASL